MLVVGIDDRRRPTPAASYRFPSLVPGTYTVKLELQGFQSIVRENVAVLVGQTTPVELQLKVASVAENSHRHRRVADGGHDERQRQSST